MKWKIKNGMIIGVFNAKLGSKQVKGKNLLGNFGYGGTKKHFLWNRNNSWIKKRSQGNHVLPEIYHASYRKVLSWVVQITRTRTLKKFQEMKKSPDEDGRTWTNVLKSQLKLFCCIRKKTLQISKPTAPSVCFQIFASFSQKSCQKSWKIKGNSINHGKRHNSDLGMELMIIY